MKILTLFVCLILLLGINANACVEDTLPSPKDSPLTVEEIKFLYMDYTCSGSYGLNYALWNEIDWEGGLVRGMGRPKPLSFVQALEKEVKLNSILSKLPIQSKTVYRKLILPIENVKANYFKGSEVNLKGFTSTSSEYVSMLRVKTQKNPRGGEVMVFFEIESTDGHDISSYSWMPKENEVLLKSKTVIKVNSIIKYKGCHRSRCRYYLPYYYIKAEEL